MKRFDVVSTLTEEQIKDLHDLFKNEWWTKHRSLEDIACILEHSFPIAFVEKETQKMIAFSRVVTDYISYAFILDVIVDPVWRKKRIGKMIMEAILSHPDLQKVEKIELKCRPELASFYEKCGFTHFSDDLILMNRKKESF